MAINQVTFDLSMKSPETGETLTARLYTVDGVNGDDGNLRNLSIGELVMAICLQRASALEAEIIKMMEEMEKTSATLEELSDYESRFIEKIQSKNIACYYIANDEADYKLLKDAGILTDKQVYLADSLPITIGGQSYDSTTAISYDDLITKIEAKMDEKNSFSQQSMIELQSYTNKRDQSYDMVSNILKSLNTVQVGIVNNI